MLNLGFKPAYVSSTTSNLDLEFKIARLSSKTYFIACFISQPRIEMS
jgi:hypothetical protein